MGFPPLKKRKKIFYFTNQFPERGGLFTSMMLYLTRCVTVWLLLDEIRGTGLQSKRNKVNKRMPSGTVIVPLMFDETPTLTRQTTLEI